MPEGELHQLRVDITTDQQRALNKACYQLLGMKRMLLSNIVDQLIQDLEKDPRNTMGNILEKKITFLKPNKEKEKEDAKDLGEE